MEGGEKSVFASFFGWPEDREFVKKERKKEEERVLGHPTAFHCEESTHRMWKHPWDLSDARQKSRELTTPPEPPNRGESATGQLSVPKARSLLGEHLLREHSSGFSSNLKKSSANIVGS